MDQLTFAIILCFVLAAVLIAIVWIFKTSPEKVKSKNLDTGADSKLAELEKRIKEIKSDNENGLKKFQIAFEERMMKFKTDYEDGLNNFQDDYAESYKEMKNKFSAFETGMQNLKKEIDHKLSEYSSKYYYLERKFRDELRNEEYESTMEAISTKLDKVEKKLSAHKHETKTARETKTTAKKKTPSRSANPSAKFKDNLQLLSGIGKVLEEQLNKRKVYTFDQIAGMTKEDVEKISKKIQGFDDKLKKNKWITQAKKLAKKVK